MKKTIGIGTVIFGFISFIFGILAEVNEGTSLTIANGTDGPTTVFIAGTTNTGWIDGVTIGIALAILGFCLFFHGEKK